MQTSSEETNSSQLLFVEEEFAKRATAASFVDEESSFSKLQEFPKTMSRI
jgi:hypothetical protein